MHDVLDLRDLVPDEAEQRELSGYPIGDLTERARAAAAAGDIEALRGVERALEAVERDPSWRYVEPTDDGTLAAMADAVAPLEVDRGTLEARVRGGWLGRAVGNTLGKPVEGLGRREVEAYLRAAGAWPMTGYVPLLDPLPDGVTALHPSASAAAAGRFTDVPRDDDIDWTILNLSLLERHGEALTTDEILAGWLDRLPFTQVYTAERAAYRNAVHGLHPPETATHRNPYREWIGALIRADAFGYVHPGDPGAAARAALVDARLSHVANGTYAEMWAAALLAAAFAADSADVAMQAAMRVVPPGSRLAEALGGVFEMREAGEDHVTALDWVDHELGRYPWVHSVNNAALIAIALLWGRTFIETAWIAIAGGRDTDSTTATVGSVYGVLHGDGSIPRELVGTTHVHVRSAVRDFDRVTIDELTQRTLAVERRMRADDPAPDTRGGASASRRVAP